MPLRHPAEDRSQEAEDARMTATLPETPSNDEDARSTAPLAGGDTKPFSVPVALPQRIDRFEIRGWLGSGAFGDVLRAYDPQLDREVALKVAKPGSLNTPERLARFLREAKAAANLRHPNIVPLYETGRDGDRLYLVSAFISGQTLEVVIQNATEKDEQLGLSYVAAVVRKLADALSYAHSQGVIHRDVKPANILVDSSGEPHLLDFGLAARADAGDERLTQDGQGMGTPAYMAPEQADGEGIAASDQYSLGCTLYEMVTGQTPFAGGPAQQMFLHKTEPVPSPRKVRAEIPRDLETMVAKCLEKEPTRRYSSCAELAEDLRRFADGVPVSARRIGPIERTVRWARRNPVVAVSVVVAVLAMVVGTGVSLWQAEEARFQQKEATEKARALGIALAEITKSEQDLQEERSKLAAQLKESRRLLDFSRLREAEADYERAEVQAAQDKLSQIASENRCIAWGLVRKRIEGSDITLWGHHNWVNCVSVTPDGGKIVTGAGDKTARVWDIVTGKTLLELKGHTDGLTGVAISTDGRRIVTGARDKTARVWDAVSGKTLVELIGHTDGVTSVAISPDNRRVVTGSWDNTARVWDAGTGKCLFELRSHTEGVMGVAISPDGRRIVTASRDKMARVWDIETGTTLLELKGHLNWVNSVAISPDGKRIVTGSSEHSARVWDAATGESLLELIAHRNEVLCVAFSPDSQRIITGSKDTTARVWDAVTGQSLLVLKGHTDIVKGVAFSVDGQRIVTCSRDETARVWNAVAGQSPFELKGHTDPVVSVAISSDGRRIVTGSGDNTARVWDTFTGKTLLELKGHADFVSSVAISPIDSRVVTGSFDKTARVWDPVTGKTLLELKGHTDHVSSVAISPDGRRIVTGSSDKTSRVWDAVTGKLLQELIGHTNGVDCVAISPDGGKVVTASSDNTAWVWDATTGKRLLELKGHDGGVNSVDISPDGRWIVTGARDNTARVWDLMTGKTTLELQGHSGTVWYAQFSQDGKRIVSVGGESEEPGELRVWDATTGQMLLEIKVHTDIVQSLALSLEANRIVTASDDGTTRVWEISFDPIPNSETEMKVPSELELMRREWLARPQPDRHTKLADDFKADPFAHAVQLSLAERARGQIAFQDCDFIAAQRHFLSAAFLKPKPHQWLEGAPPPRPVIR